MQNFSEQQAISAKGVPAMTTKTLTYCAILAALGVVLGRVFGLMPSAYSRFSIESLPVFLSGILFGPLAGALVGFTSDAVGTLFSGYGFNPLFSVPPILYGLCGGLFQGFLAKKMNFGRLLLAISPAVVFGSILWQSAALTFIYFKDGPFMEGFLIRLTSRSIQFGITMIVVALLTHLLFRSNIIQRIGLWPLPKKSKNQL